MILLWIREPLPHLLLARPPIHCYRDWSLGAPRLPLSEFGLLEGNVSRLFAPFGVQALIKLTVTTWLRRW